MMKRRWMGWTMAWVWALLLCAGSMLLLRFETQASEKVVALGRWPAASRIPRASSEPVVVMFLHPNCPCSHASVHELVKAMSGVPAQQAPRVVFVLRTEAVGDWRAASLRRAAAAIPRSILLEDDGGREAALFGAQTSGLVLFYDGAGVLGFQGGITAGRGHKGANRSEEALVGLLRGPSAAATTPVYGCSLEARRQPAKGAKSCPTRS
jgi:hypothetical protein